MVLDHRTFPRSIIHRETLASAVTPDYLNVMRLPCCAVASSMTTTRLGGTQVVVIDEKMAHHAFGAEDPVGKLFRIPAMGTSLFEVVGVVGHVRIGDLQGRPLKNSGPTLLPYRPSSGSSSCDSFRRNLASSSAPTFLL